MGPTGCGIPRRPQMLRAEAPLIEVGQVLRHRSAATTAIYAKVDRGRLRELAAAWPQVSR